jgi:hypothetical protein
MTYPIVREHWKNCSTKPDLMDDVPGTNDGSFGVVSHLKTIAKACHSNYSNSALAGDLNASKGS